MSESTLSIVLRHRAFQYSVTVQYIGTVLLAGSEPLRDGRDGNLLHKSGTARQTQQQANQQKQQRGMREACSTFKQLREPKSPALFFTGVSSINRSSIVRYSGEVAKARDWKVEALVCGCKCSASAVREHGRRALQRIREPFLPPSVPLDTFSRRVRKGGKGRRQVPATEILHCTLVTDSRLLCPAIRCTSPPSSPTNSPIRFNIGQSAFGSPPITSTSRCLWCTQHEPVCMKYLCASPGTHFECTPWTVMLNKGQVTKAVITGWGLQPDFHSAVCVFTLLITQLGEIG
ncbi:hypothetical protein B0H66DRAFT_528365 [Apodospora peruviana]|uniref:Uncharacterized protein n=1 Tax=Apodospora peruviana TaxID=516989 RepID=A0AAE0IU69_9PEZI|nr:hypothetical protein B0H66DRAFT_528365 [Apodospora peruviana]